MKQRLRGNRKIVNYLLDTLFKNEQGSNMSVGQAYTRVYMLYPEINREGFEQVVSARYEIINDRGVNFIVNTNFNDMVDILDEDYTDYSVMHPYKIKDIDVFISKVLMADDDIKMLKFKDVYKKVCSEVYQVRKRQLKLILRYLNYQVYRYIGNTLCVMKK